MAGSRPSRAISANLSQPLRSPALRKPRPRRADRTASLGGTEVKLRTAPPAPAFGGSRPRWRHAFGASIRPRGVRWISPCCSRNGSITSSIASRLSDSAADEGLHPYRSAAVVFGDQREIPPVRPVEPEVVDPQPRQRPVRDRARQPPVAFDQGEIHDPAQQPPRDPRRAPRAPRDLQRAVGLGRNAQQPRAARDDLVQLVPRCRTGAASGCRSGRAAASSAARAASSRPPA